MEELYRKHIIIEYNLSYFNRLHDSLLCQILSYLPTKEVVKTSVLSKRWKRLWLLTPNLDIDANEFPNYNTFVSFIDRFFDFSKEEKLIFHKLKLSIRKSVNDPPCFTRWISFVSTRKLEQLDVECLVNRNFLELLPLSVYVCDTLVYLRLHRVFFGEFDDQSCVTLPHLKKMSLEHNIYTDEAGLESFISSCSILEDLSIVRMFNDNIKILRVCSQTVTRLVIDYCIGMEDDDFVDGYEREGGGVFIDAPRLKYLKFEDDLSDSKIISNSASLDEIDLVYVFNVENDLADSVELPKLNMIRNFFTSISRVTNMIISLHTVEFLYYNMDFDPLPQFHNLSRLEVTFTMYYLETLPTILESCPNLKSLVLVLDFDPWDKRVVINLTSVPPCLVSSLEFVEIKQFNGGLDKMKLVRYFLENSAVLEKLVLDLRYYKVEDGFVMMRDLLALPRRSNTCQIVVS